jgi:predicted kinase
MLIGPPASGKSTFAAELVGQGRVDAAAVVSSDDTAMELFGLNVDREVADPLIFTERDRRVAQRLAGGRVAVVDATNVLPAARARLVAIASRFGSPAVALRFAQPQDVLIAQNDERDKRLPVQQVRDYASLMAAHATQGRLCSEDMWAVLDVPGRCQQVTSAQAACRFEFG